MNIASFYDFVIKFLNCSNNVVFFGFFFIFIEIYDRSAEKHWQTFCIMSTQIILLMYGNILLWSHHAVVSRYNTVKFYLFFYGKQSKFNVLYKQLMLKKNI